MLQTVQLWKPSWFLRACTCTCRASPNIQLKTTYWTHANFAKHFAWQKRCYDATQYFRAATLAIFVVFFSFRKAAYRNGFYNKIVSSDIYYVTSDRRGCKYILYLVLQVNAKIGKPLGRLLEKLDWITLQLQAVNSRFSTYSAKYRSSRKYSATTMHTKNYVATDNLTSAIACAILHPAQGHSKQDWLIACTHPSNSIHSGFFA